MIMTIFAAIGAGIMFAIEVPAAVYAGRYYDSYYSRYNYFQSYYSYNYHGRNNEQVICKLCFYKFISPIFGLHGTVSTEIITR